mgnify:CR=1 FL=1
MIIVSHRANLEGKNKSTENHPDQIRKVSKYFLVEADIWYKGGWYLGHDKPEHHIKLHSFLNLKDRILFHCKNKMAAERLFESEFHWFWHQRDDMTLTSRGWMWCFPNKPVKGGILVDFKKPRYIKDIRGVCVDNPIEWSNVK